MTNTALMDLLRDEAQRDIARQIEHVKRCIALLDAAVLFDSMALNADGVAAKEVMRSGYQDRLATLEAGGSERGETR